MRTNLDVESRSTDRMRSRLDPRSAPARTIATYRDYRRAVAAVAHLEEQDTSAEVHIALVRFVRARTRPKTSIVRSGWEATVRALVPTLGVLALATATGAIGVRSLTMVGLVTVAVCLLVGSSLGLRRGAGNAIPITRPDLVPTAYEIRCSGGDAVATRAAHRLARWWRPGLEDEPMTPDWRRVVGEA